MPWLLTGWDAHAWWLPVRIAGVLLIVYAFVRLYEEPVLARRFGEQFESYRRSVPGWIPRRPST